MHALISLRLCTALYDPLRASSFVRLPEWILLKKACINIHNLEDNRCFLYSVLCHYHHTDVKADERHLPSAYTQFEAEVDMTGIGYPAAIAGDLERFERQNPGAVNIFSLGKNKKIKSLRISMKKGNTATIPPPLFYDG